MDLFKRSTMFKVLCVVGLVAYIGSRPDSQILRLISQQTGIQFGVAAKSDAESAIAAVAAKKDAGVDAANNTDDTFCRPMSAAERENLKEESGSDIASFIEESTKRLHAALTPEEQMEVIATRFDHKRWSEAWSAGKYDEKNTPDDNEKLQLNLTHATLFLSRYHRLIDNGRRQEDSAARAFRWPTADIEEMQREPMRAMVRKFRSMSCGLAETEQYGCRDGETIWMVQTVLSPRLACRFSEKREQYQATFWVRVTPDGARIVEVDANSQRLVKSTYAELEQRELLTIISPKVNELLIGAGLDPLRIPTLWRLWQAPAGTKTPPTANLVSPLEETTETASVHQVEIIPSADPALVTKAATAVEAVAPATTQSSETVQPAAAQTTAEQPTAAAAVEPVAATESREPASVPVAAAVQSPAAPAVVPAAASVTTEAAPAAAPVAPAAKSFTPPVIETGSAEVI